MDFEEQLIYLQTRIEAGLSDHWPVKYILNFPTVDGVQEIIIFLSPGLWEEPYDNPNAMFSIFKIKPDGRGWLSQKKNKILWHRFKENTNWEKGLCNQYKRIQNLINTDLGNTAVITTEIGTSVAKGIIERCKLNNTNSF